MALVSQNRSRERILAMGGTGAGKTYALLSVAKKIAPAKVRVVSVGDNAYDRLLETEFKGLDNVEVRSAWDWPSLMKNVSEYMDESERDDWLVIDLLSPCWQMVQDWFSETVFGDDLAAMMLARRQAVKEINDKAKTDKDKVKSIQPFDGFLDWSVINPQWKKLMDRLLQCPCHVYVTTEVKAIGDRDPKDVQEMFGQTGKPDGQKNTGHRFSSVLAFKKGRKERVFTTVKDYGRKEVEDEPVGDFAMSYLMKIAGWRPQQAAGD